MFSHAGADAMLVFEFGAELASMDAEQFISEVLGRQIGVSGVITGDDFSFGKGRSGDPALLAKLGSNYGIAAEAVPQVVLDGERISSGKIREALVAGDTATATRMLSRSFAIEGVVQSGDRRGRELGYPTANLVLGRYLRPRYGIYAVRVTLEDGTEHPGVASLGTRPTFDPPQELLETHLLDFDGDLYGKKIEVALHDFIREELKFASVDALVATMRSDEAAARRLLALE
jgi:riboflavin kinase/FMN adenylyltransferase